jgi:tetratricopeptide (TPR) repeat protein
MNFDLGAVMTALNQRSRHGRGAVRMLTGLVLAALALPAAYAQAPDAAPAPMAEPPTHSAMDTPLFYQLLIGELELRGGAAGNAYEVMLDAARRTRDEALFRRTVDIALQGRAGEQALTAVQAWRVATPDSGEALRYQIQLLTAMNRQAEAVEPLQALLSAAPAAERPGIIAALPRLFLRGGDRRQAVVLLEQVLKPYLEAPDTRAVARISLARGWLAAGDAAQALSMAQRAQADDPAAPAPALLAMDMMTGTPAAEALVLAYLAQSSAEPGVRLAYVRALTAAQRYGDAIAQLKRVTADQPELAPPWLSLGALQLELRQPREAERALTRYVQLAQAAPAVPPAAADDDDDDAPPPGDRGLAQAWLLLAQAAEQQGDFAGAERWLSRVDNPQRVLEVQTRRASMLARQNKVGEAQELIRRVPERTAEDGRAKALAEAQVMRDVKHWREAHEVLAAANQRYTGDADLLYEQAMAAEKLEQFDDMEHLLKRVIELKPEHYHAYNALGYSLADRNLRLTDARALIRKALDLSPGDPFITDSLGWVEYRLGNRNEALRLLRTAYSARPDTEIGAHLGEVLWVDGQRDEARRVLREAKGRDAGNDVLRETLARLKVDL